MNMVGFPIHFDQLGFKALADLNEHVSEPLDGVSVENLLAVFGDEDQVHMHCEHAMSTVPNIACNHHRPTIQLRAEEMRRTFKYRLYPNHQQQEKLQATLDVCRELYNAGLQERRDAWSVARKSVGYVEQADQLGDIKSIRDDVAAVHSQVLQDVLRRLDKTFHAFFLRCKRGQKPGFPRFRSKARYDSFTYPQSGYQLNGRLQLSKVGTVKIKLHRPIKGDIKTLTVKRENGHWYACFSCEVEPEPLPASTKVIGMDVGLASFAVLSDGTEISNPRPFQKAQKRLRRAQRRVARRKKFSHRWKKAVRLVARIHRAVFNQRNDFQHKLSRNIVNKYGTIVAEDLNVKGLSRGMLAKYVRDAGWTAFFSKLAYKAESAGRQLLLVDARGTSQRCPCGEPNLKLLSDREHVCTACGLVTSRDHSSAMEILRLGLSLQASTERHVASVA
jgi:putative transposase